jgi:hypothetical protein
LRLFSDQDYAPDKTRLLGKADLVKQAAVCVAEGEVSGTFQDFVIDPAGDYEVAWPGYAGARIPVLTLGDMLFVNVAVSPDPVEGALPRIGGRLLERYQVTLAPSQSRIWFEKP